MKDNKGLTLIELLVAIAIFSIVIVLIFNSYLSILKHQSQQASIAQNNISRLVSLSIIRRDIEMAGFGLPWVINSSYSEASGNSSYTPSPSSLNANLPSEPPAFSFSNNGNKNANNSDVLVIRSAMADLNGISSHWGYIYQDSDGNGHFKNLEENSSISSGSYFSVINPVNMEFVGYSTFGDLPFFNTNKNTYLTFGLSNSQPRMPFNRVDYYLAKPASGLPSVCDKNTFNLYRATISQADGSRKQKILLECVKDFQVAFICSNGINTCLDSSSDERKNLKQVRVFILLQEGRKDVHFTFNGTIKIKDDVVNTGKTFIPTGDDSHYRWKLIELMVDPINVNIRKRDYN